MNLTSTCNFWSARFYEGVIKERRQLKPNTHKIKLLLEWSTYIGSVAMQVYINSGCTQVAWLINNADDIPRLQECMICTSSLRRRRPPSVAAAPSAHEALVRESSAAPAGWMIFFPPGIFHYHKCAHGRRRLMHLLIRTRHHRKISMQQQCV